MDKHKKGKKNSGSEARLKRFKKILWGGLAAGIVLAVLLFFLIEKGLFGELPTFEEAGACGTAAVISPIGSIYDPDSGQTYIYGDGQTAGPWCTKLYEHLRGIQYGEIADPYGWVTVL